MIGDTLVGGGTIELVPNYHLSFVEFRQEHTPEVDRPDPVAGFLETDVMLLEGVGDEEEFVLESERPGAGDPFDDEVPRILQRRQLLGKAAERRTVVRAGRLAPEGGMRSLVVVQRSERSEGALLRPEIRAWGPAGSGLEGSVHAFMRTVLLGGSRMNPLMLDAEAHPPDVESREPVDAGARERPAIVRSNGARQPKLPKGPLEDRARATASDVRQSPTRQEIA